MGEDADENHDEEPSEEADDEGPVQFSASAPSGSNTCPPGYVSVNKRKPQMNNHNVSSKGNAAPAKRPSGPQKLQRSNGSGQLLRFQKQVGRLAKENETLRLKFQRSERERDLMELAAEGFDFDPVEELDYVTQLPDDHYNYHLNRIKKRYQRAPVGEARFNLEMSRSPQPNGTSSGRTAEQARQVAAYATKKGISYEDALVALGNEDAD
jgi:hypothetical protein